MKVMSVMFKIKRTLDESVDYDIIKETLKVPVNRYEYTPKIVIFLFSYTGKEHQ